MSKLLTPAFWIPMTFMGCGLTILVLPDGGGIRQAAIIMLFFMIAFFVSTLAHEVGHVIGAIVAKFQIVNFVVGPLLIAAKVVGGYKALPNLNSKVWAGYVLALPRGFDNLRRRFSVFVGGGPFASLLFGLVVMLFAINAWQGWKTTIPEGISPANFNLWSGGCLLSVVGIMSLVFFLINIMPFHTGVLASDGLRLLQLARGGSKAKRTTALLVCSSLLTLRKRPSNLPVDVIQDLLLVHDNTPDEAEALLVAYLFALDNGKIEEADQHITALKRVGRKASTLSQPLMACWIAFHEGIYRLNLDEARNWLSEANIRDMNRSTLLYQMAYASVLFLDGQDLQATQCLQQWSALFSQEAKRGGEIILFFKEQMERITKRYISVIKPALDKARN